MLPFSSSIPVRPAVTLPTTQTPALHAAIKNAMGRQDDNAVRQQLDKANLSSDCNLPSRQTALELAVQHNDLPLARQALQQGADPEKITAHPQADSMRSLLTYARRKNKLYPPNASRAQDTDLDRALRDGLDDNAREEARNFLRQAAPGKKVREAWRDAVKENRVDVQRAILLLEADQDRGFRLKQEEAVTDKGVAEVMKEIPYFSPKRKLLQNFNCKATFPDTSKAIECRHLVEYRQSVQERRPQIKFDDAQFARKQAIAANVSFDTEAKHNHLIAHAKEARLFHNRDFGKVLVQQLAAMAAGDEASRLILLISTDHAMSVGLKRKEKDGKPYYVAELFDPNLTTSHVRIASDSLSTLETLTLENLIDGADLYQDYYPEPDGLSMMFVRPPLQEEQAIEEQAMTGMAQGAVENRTLTSSIEDKDINATALFYILKDGFAGDLRRLKGEIASRPEKERIALLAAKNANGYPGLYVALQNGHADAIEAFGELLLLVPEEQRAALLAAKDANGNREPGLYMALQNGHADAIEAFGELLLLVPEEQRAALLAAKDANGNREPGLYMALQNGHADAIEAFGKLLLLVPAEQRAALLAAKNADGDPGLYIALQEGHADAIKAFGAFLLLVPEGQRAALLGAKNADGDPGLYIALQNGHADAIRAFGKLLLLVPAEQRAQLLAVTVNESSGLANALKKGKLEALEQYMETVKKIAPALSAQERAALLKYIRKSHAVQRWGMWFNTSYYKALKKENPDFHLRFIEMENALKP